MGAYRDNIPDNLRCSFCSKGKGDVDKLVAGPQVHICNECINLCIEIIIMDAMQECIPIGDLLPSLDEVEDALLETERFRFVQGIKIPPKNP